MRGSSNFPSLRDKFRNLMDRLAVIQFMDRQQQVVVYTNFTDELGDIIDVILANKLE